MKIYKIIADSKPVRCNECPAREIRPCGEQVERQDGEWTQIFNVPDDRCVVEVATVDGY